MRVSVGFRCGSAPLKLFCLWTGTWHAIPHKYLASVVRCYLKKTFLIMNLRLIILTLTLVFGLTSCSSFIQLLYGIKYPMTVNEKTIVRYSKKYNIPPTDCFEMDTSYMSFLFSIDSTKYKTQIKNHYQPLQALYYNKSGKLKSFK